VARDIAVEVADEEVFIKAGAEIGWVAGEKTIGEGS